MDDTDKTAVAERRAQNRRIGVDRRAAGKNAKFDGTERRKTPRRQVERRRLIDPTTCERDYSGDEIEFMKAMDDYKRKRGSMFPTWSEVLDVVRSLGYSRPEQPAQAEQIEFTRAMDDYKVKSGRMFPTWSEVLEVVRSVGYSKPLQPVPAEQPKPLPV